MKIAYKFIPLVGKQVEIVAKTKTQAIETYSKWTGISKDFIKKHIRVVNAGVVKDGEIPRLV